MATRGMLFRLREDGKTYDYRYHHSDSYPDYLGEMLLDHYTDPEKVNQLFALGDLSIIDEEIGEAHLGFPSDRYNVLYPKSGTLLEESANSTWTRAYHRDRGEELRLNTTTDLNKAADNCNAEYAYEWLAEKQTWQGFEVQRGGLAEIDIRTYGQDEEEV